jgi:quercetin dioxygenase-like cupin family protein
MRIIILLTGFILAISVNAAEEDMKKNAEEISQHYHALPSQYDFNSVKIEKISDTISRQYVMGAQSMLVKWTLKKGAIIPMHFHVNEQMTWITEGAVEVLSQGKTFVIKAGGILIIPANVPHEFHALEDTIDIDVFTPVRQDWLDVSANYLPKTNS